MATAWPSWSEVVSPFWPQLLLGNSGLVAEAEDPDLTVFQPPPRAGLDYPVFPPFPPPQQSWTADTPEDEIQNLDALSLLAHGLVIQGDGNYRCWYCEAVFSDVSKHLHPHYNVAKRHEKNRAYWQDYVSWITTKGHDLQDFAKIEGNKFKCRCGDGPCYEIMQHFSSNKHVNMAKSLQKPSQELQARRKAMWQQACVELEESHLRKSIERQESLSKAMLAPTSSAAPVVAKPAPVVAKPEGKDSALLVSPLPRRGTDYPDLDATITSDYIEDAWCHACEGPVQDVKAHVESREHRGFAKEAFDVIQAQGDSLRKHALRLDEKKLSCDKHVRWWELPGWLGQGHGSTKNHVRAMTYFYLPSLSAEQENERKQEICRMVASNDHVENRPSEPPLKTSKKTAAARVKVVPTKHLAFQQLVQPAKIPVLALALPVTGGSFGCGCDKEIERRGKDRVYGAVGL